MKRVLKWTGLGLIYLAVAAIVRSHYQSEYSQVPQPPIDVEYLRSLFHGYGE